MKIGLMGAMPEEMKKILQTIDNPTTTHSAGRLYYEGTLDGVQVVGVFSRWGKVAAATTATELILKFKVQHILFTGIAGALDDTLNVGDVVVARNFYQHDMDARPLMPRLQIPLLGKDNFSTKPEDTQRGVEAVKNFIDSDKDFLRKLHLAGLSKPAVYAGDMASGDLFVSSTKMRNSIRKNVPSALCVDMESAAVAQVCEDYDCPLTVVRVISDAANETSSVGAMNFVNEHGADYSLGIAKQYLEMLKRSETTSPHIEIERKFLVRDDSYKLMATHHEHIMQGYISQDPDRTVRVRLKGDNGYVTFKNKPNENGWSRYEYEVKITKTDAEELMSLCHSPVIDKIRHYVPMDDVCFEVDEFRGENEGLVVAEVELESELQTFSKPAFLGKEVTGDERYYNVMLAKKPYKIW
jgi:adenosylhomocysteine nucleosidase